MNDDDENLEAELQRLTLRTPSRRLEDRIAAELACASAPPRQAPSPLFPTWKWAAILTPLATAAAFAIVFLHRPADELQPVSVANVLYDTEDEGVVTMEDGQPAQRVRLRYIDTIIWANSRGGTSLQWSQPRDEIQLLPLTYN